MIIISDTHGKHRDLNLGPADILIHAGDLTGDGSLDDLKDFNDWLGTLDILTKIIVAGNHDWCFYHRKEESIRILTNAIYLEDSGVMVDGIKFWGSPWQPEFHNWAFNLRRGPDLKKHWDLIPNDTDILITHSPPYKVGDMTSIGLHEGCKDLMNAVRRIQPSLHVFGHIHEAYGIYNNFINASVLNLRYKLVNEPVII